MKSYVSVIFLAFCFTMGTTRHQVLASSITEDKAAIGYHSVASGFCSIAIGYSAEASGGGSIAMGAEATASGSDSIAIGNNTTAGGSCSFAAGRFMQLAETAWGTFAWGYDDGAQTISTSRAFLIFPVGYPGEVGIGTPNPEEKVHIRRKSDVLGAAILLDSTDVTKGRKFYLGSTLAGNYGGAGLFQIFDVTAQQARLNISPSGNVGIGTINPGALLEVNGSAAKPGGGSWSVSSDERLKDITANYDRGLKAILELKPITFFYKHGNPRRLPTDEEYIGFVAQEVQKIFPEAVSEGQDGYLDFNMHPVNVAVVNAIKELKAENDNLKAENDMLRQKIEKIEALLGI